MRLRLAFACLAFALCGALAAGCAQSSPAGSPRQGETPAPPTVTLADPLARNALLQNEAYYAGLTATAVTQNGIATQSALMQVTETARQASVRGTALAVEVQATATAAEIALQDQAARSSMAATATVSAQRHADVLATQTAADALRRATEAQERARAGEWAELDRQAGFVVKLGLGMLAVIALAVLVYHAARWLSVIIAIDARRRLVLERAGLVFDNDAGEWKLLPGQATLPPPPTPERPPLRINRRQPPVDERLARERAQRMAWRNAARDFLLLGERLGGYGKRGFADAGVSEADWHAMTAFLSGLGFLVKAGDRANAPYVLAAAGDGRQLTAREAVRAPKWVTSFALPSPVPPAIPEQKRVDGARHATPRQPPPATTPGPSRPKSTWWRGNGPTRRARSTRPATAWLCRSTWMAISGH